MRIHTHLFLLLLGLLPSGLMAQTDSLIRFADLQYHSEFERKAIQQFMSQQGDTLDLFLAIDDTMDEKIAAEKKEIYQSIFKELEVKKIASKNMSKKIKLAYSGVHSRFLKKYNEDVYFPEIFESGNYNCVTASMLYAMVYSKLNVPYKVKASSGHVYLVANPSANSIVIETTNPGFEKQIFTGEFKQQYINYLRNSKLISESEYKNKSVEEIFEEKFNEVRDAEFNNLPGFQYYNKALTSLQKNETEAALKSCQKAYFFYPDYQVKNLLYSALIYHIEKCNFDQVWEIDYLAQLSKFENTDMNVVVGIFSNIVNYHLQYTDMEAFCDSLNARLVGQITDKKLIDEINFSYNLQMSYRYQHSDMVEKYVARALDIKGNHHDAQQIMENHLQRKLFNISNPDVLLDTINQLALRYPQELVVSILTEHKLKAYLQKASDSFSKNKSPEGNTYLLEFEKNCEPPVKSKMLNVMIESTYRSAALHYFYKGNKTTARAFVNRGLKYVPNSSLLESAIN